MRQLFAGRRGRTPSSCSVSEHQRWQSTWSKMGQQELLRVYFGGFAGGHDTGRPSWAALHDGKRPPEQEARGPGERPHGSPSLIDRSKGASMLHCHWPSSPPQTHRTQHRRCRMTPTWSLKKRDGPTERVMTRGWQRNREGRGPNQVQRCFEKQECHSPCFRRKANRNVGQKFELLRWISVGQRLEIEKCFGEDK